MCCAVVALVLRAWLSLLCIIVCGVQGGQFQDTRKPPTRVCLTEEVDEMGEWEVGGGRTVVVVLFGVWCLAWFWVYFFTGRLFISHVSIVLVRLTSHQQLDFSPVVNFVEIRVKLALVVSVST